MPSPAHVFDQGELHLHVVGALCHLDHCDAQRPHVATVGRVGTAQTLG